jgi:hypothetical protein
MRADRRRWADLEILQDEGLLNAHGLENHDKYVLQAQLVIERLLKRFKSLLQGQ